MNLHRRSVVLGFLTTPILKRFQGTTPAQADLGGPAMLNVRHFGAAGDGLHDDSQAFKTGLAAAAAAGLGARLYVPSGRYKIPGLTIQGQPIQVLGDGDSSVLVGDPNKSILTMTDCPVVDMRRLAFLGQSQGAPGDYALIEVVNSPDVTLRRIRTDSGGGDGADIRSCDGIDISDCAFAKNARYGLRIRDNAALSRPRRIRRCTATDNGAHGILLQRIVGFDIEANIVMHNRSQGIHATDGSDWLRVFHNRCTGNGTSTLEHGIYILRSKAVVAHGNSSFGNAGDGLLLRECNDSIVANNVVTDNHRHGLSVQDFEGVPADAFVVVGNLGLRNEELGIAATGISRAIYSSNLAADNTRFGLAGYVGPSRALTRIAFVSNLSLGNAEGGLLLAGAQSAAVIGNVLENQPNATVPAVALKTFQGHPVELARTVGNVELTGQPSSSAPDLKGMANLVDHLSSDTPVH